MQPYADIVLRWGLAFAFLYPAANALIDPYSWIGYFPSFTQGLVPDMVLLHTFGAVEAVISIWLIIGRQVYIPAAVALVILVAIIALNTAQMQVIFRDVSIAAIALALVLAHWPRSSRSTEAV